MEYQTLKEIQNELKIMTDAFGLNMDTKIRYLDLVSEVGEIGKEILVSSDYGNKEEQCTENFVLEVGDTFFALLCLCQSKNIDLALALEKVMEKYQKRSLKKGKIGSLE